MVQEQKSTANFWNNALPEEGRRIVDACVEPVAQQDWRQRRDTIEAAVATSDMANKLSARCPEASLFMTSAIVAAIIEFLEAPRIAEADQAQLFAMSASLDHQAAACDWFIEACAHASGFAGSFIAVRGSDSALIAGASGPQIYFLFCLNFCGWSVRIFRSVRRHCECKKNRVAVFAYLKTQQDQSPSG